MVTINLRSSAFVLNLIFFCQTMFASETNRPMTLARIDEVAVNAQIPQIKQALKQNRLLRKVVCGFGAAAAIGGSAYLCYNGFFGDSTKEATCQSNRAIDQLLEHGCGVESIKKLAYMLSEKVSVLTNKVAVLEGEHGALKEKITGGIRLPQWCKSRFFTTAKSLVMFCVHTIATSIIWNQVINTQRYCQSFFKDRDLKWYLYMHTQLGIFTNFEDSEGNYREHFQEAQLLQELKGIAQLFDEDVSGDARRLQQLSQMVCSVTTAILGQVTQVVAYMNYVCSSFSPQMLQVQQIAQKREEALSYAHYLRSHANECAKSIEILVEKKLNEPAQKGGLLDAVNKFINDLKTMVMGFNRIQQEVGATE